MRVAGAVTLAALLVVCTALEKEGVKRRPQQANRPSIYPDDHWDYSYKMTKATFDDHVKQEVDAGRTLFVKWIASEG